MSISYLAKQVGSGSRGGLALAFAAIVLVLHWAAPSFKPLDIPQRHSDADAGYFTIEAGSYRSTLPRILTRSHAFETGLAKPSRGTWPAGGKIDALPQYAGFAAPPGAVQIVHSCGEGPRHPSAAHQFQARAPPSALA